MSQALPVTGVVPLVQMAGEDDIETAMLVAMAEEAQAFLTNYNWCEEIQALYFGDGIGGVFAVFFAHIKPARPEVDENLWIVVGDIPSAYLVTDSCHTPKEAMEGYIEEMRKWVEAAKLGQTSKEIIPVNVPATPEWAERLETRLNTLEHEILPTWFVQEG